MSEPLAAPSLEIRLPDDDDRRRKREARALWEGDRTSLIFESPFLASLALHLDLVPVMDDRVRTACTDGRRIFVDVDYLASLSEDGRLFLLAHEVWHSALGHFVREGERDPERWNLAVDHEVNSLLAEQGLAVPSDAILYPDQRGRSAEEVYDWLLDAPAEARAQERGDSADQHLGGGAGQGAPRKRRRKRSAGSGGPSVWRHDPDYAPYIDPADRNLWPGRIVVAGMKEERRAGTLPAGLQRLLDALRQPAVPWREVLRQFITREFGGARTWLPPSRRHVARGLFLPSRREDAIALTIAIDTSGSTTDYLAAFLGEVDGLVRTFGRYRLRLLQCDAAIAADETFDEDRPLEAKDVTMCGFGGTAFAPVFERLDAEGADRPLLYFTDGFGSDAPAHPPRYPVLWVLTPGGAPPAPWGEVLVLPAAAAAPDASVPSR